MSEKLKPELDPIEDNENQNEPLPLEEQVSLELVEHNYTEAKLQEFEEYLKLDIVDGDKESYMLVKEKRKEVKSYRVAVEKFCKFKREPAVQVQKAWVKKEGVIAGRLSVVEDHLEAKEKAYEKKAAEEKEARKRKQEEQLILRQQELTSIGVLYSDGKFFLGDVSFELSAIKESDNDIWNETIWPLYKQAYEAIEADRIGQERLTKEREAELKRQQEEMEKKRKELEEKEAELKREEERQAKERDNKEREKLRERIGALMSLGFKSDSELCAWVGYGVGIEDSYIKDHTDDQWNTLIGNITKKVDEVKAAEAEEKRKEQERKDLQDKRYAELLPLKEYGEPVEMDKLWLLEDVSYMGIRERKEAALQKSEEEKANRIAEEAAKKERERIEEEQRQADIKRVNELRRDRTNVLKQYNADFDLVQSDLGEITEEAWAVILTDIKDIFEEKKRKQEEERKAEELAQASEKVKWKHLVDVLSALQIPKFVSGQYAKKAAILREKLEEIKAL